jgi:signal transduction histidine kinase
MTLTSDVDLAVLCEEVLESSFAGFNFQQSATQFFETPSSKAAVPPIAVIVDINKSENYVFRTQPGAWRRVLMNLFGNALKYTPAGFIRVKLQVTKVTPEFTFGAPLPSVLNTFSDHPQDETFEFRLIITDSGIGMSEGYVNNRLFHSFAQENPLSQGTGLGLSIVKQIVESLGGDVEVRSEKGRGTKFTVRKLPTSNRLCSPLLYSF